MLVKIYVGNHYLIETTWIRDLGSSIYDVQTNKGRFQKKIDSNFGQMCMLKRKGMAEK